VSATCRLCGGALAEWLRDVQDPYSSERFRVLTCEGCGVGQTDPVPPDLGRYYGAAYYGGRHGLSARFRAWRRLQRLERVAGAARGALLDVGCGEGTFLLQARARGWSVAGTELHPGPAQAQGLEVRARPDDFGDRLFDAATFWHTLEHFPDPAEVLRETAGHLRPGALLLVAVPDAAGLQARLFGRHWLHLDVPRHLFHFGERGLVALLQRCGFRVERRWHQEFEYDLLGWSQSALNALLPSAPNAFFDALRGRARPLGGPLRLLNGALGVGLSAAAVSAVVGGSLAGRGGTLVVAARWPGDATAARAA
jgi:SAM-dependent methyltransferase